jgi:preprotein translocase subunit YajC
MNAMSLLCVLLQATPDTGAAASPLGNNSGWIMMIAIVAIFYFFMIRPQQKKQKEIQKARNAIQTGDKVITSGGVHAKVKKVNDDHFVVEIADNVEIKIDKTSVFSLPNAAK